MKTIFLLLFLVAFLKIFPQYGKKQFELKGKIENQTTGYIKLNYINDKGVYIKDSAQINNGKFYFKGFIPHPIYADIYGDKLTRGTNDINFQSIFMEPGVMTINIVKDRFKDLQLKGSKIQTIIDSLRKTFAYNTIVDSLEREEFKLDLLLKENPTQVSYKESRQQIRNKLTPYYKEINERHYNYMISHLGSYYSIMFFENYVYRLPIDSLKNLFNNFDKKLQQSFYGKRIAEQIRGIQGGSPGSKAKSFNTVDMNGNPISLDQFKGTNYVLLDFWATWCKPCREESPFLVELYTKFKSKGLEIISIANDDNRKEAWKKAIQDDKTGAWTHVLQGAGTLNDLGLQYAIQPIPAKILIGKDGTILMRYEGTEGNKSLMDALTKNLK